MKNAEMMFCENEPYIMDVMKRWIHFSV